ncbi:hypothetical protein IWX90DRAFT_427690 [Phyllosticta citrichinensis]|uniref:Myb-like domain-containing protein n=1 Tax=Phyllosticta citrichinensis TaxID=1130410 RepID=A0ABR1XZG0_9PEZI
MVVEARGLRSSSRRTQPTSAVAANASPRAMRANSQDINPTRQASPPQRTTRGQARAASLESTLSTDGASRASRRTAKQAGAVRELPTVEEDAGFQQRGLAELPATEDHPDREEIQIFQSAADYQAEGSPGTASIASTSAETLHPPSDLDVLLMVDSLGDLYTDANKVLEKIAPENASRAELRNLYSDFRKPGSAVNRVLSKRIERFERSCEIFGAEEYVRSDVVKAAFAGQTPAPNTGKPLPLRVDPILQKANLALLALRMRDIERETSRTYDILRLLDDTFPRDFVSSDEVGADDGSMTRANDALYELGLEIRTQCAIRVMFENQDKKDFWPQQDILETFFLANGEGYGVDAEHRSLRGWEVLGLDSTEEGLPKAVEDLVHKRVDEFRACLPESDTAEDVDFEQLEAKFPWSRFITQLLEWVSRRNEEIETEISHFGGIRAIQSALQEHVDPVDRHPTQTSNIAPLTQPADPEPPPQQKSQFASTAPGVISVLKKLKQKVDRLSGGGAREEAAAAAETRQPRAPRAEEIEDEWQLIANEEEDISATAVEIQEPPPYAAKQVFMDQIRLMERQNKENINRVQSEKEKTKSIFDRQPDAHKVSFDEDVIGQSPAKRPGAPSTSPAKRRRAADEVEEEEEDDEFQTDPRQTAARRRQEAPAKRRRIMRAPRRATSLASTRGQTDGNEDNGDETVVEDVDVVSRLARRQGTALPPVTAAGNKRKRFPWTEQEDKQLIALFRIYGGGKQPWKRIKEADEADLDILHRRDPVALKDRVRTLCFIYDKANTGRPDVFEGLEIGDFYKRKVDQKLGRLPSEVPAE